jgi:hypothetical protein
MEAIGTAGAAFCDAAPVRSGGANEERRNEERRTKHMNEASAQKLANVLIGAVVVGAAYYVIRTPPLRRLAWRLLVTAATGSLPLWLREEIQQGWEASARPGHLRQSELQPSAHTRDGTHASVGTLQG